MNKGYAYVNGKAIVTDEEGIKKIVDYTDNLDDILVTENIIEFLEQEQKELEEALKNIGDVKNLKTIARNNLIAGFVGAGFGSALSFVWENFMINKHNIIPVIEKTLFGTIRTSVGVAASVSIFCILTSITIAIKEYLEYKELSSYKNGLYNEKEHLTDILMKTEESLQLLIENAKSITLEKDFEIRKISYLNELEKLESYLSLCFKCGENEQKYNRYYQSGKLDDKLKDIYDDSQIGEIKAYLDSKETLVTRKRILSTK